MTITTGGEVYNGDECLGHLCGTCGRSGEGKMWTKNPGYHIWHMQPGDV